MKKYFIILIVFAFSCGTNDSKKRENFTLEVDLDLNKKLNLSEIATSVDYIGLKNFDLEVLVEPNKILFENNHIFIEDTFNEKIVVFDNSGNFVKNIGLSGDGPFQVMTVDDFSISRDTVWIKDSKLKKMVAFDLDGTPIFEKRLHITRGPFIRGAGFHLYSTNNNTELGYKILRIDDEGKVTGFFEIEPWFEHKLIKTTNSFVFDKSMNRSYFLIPFSNQLVLFDSAGNVKKSIKIDFGKYEFKTEFWKNIKDNFEQILFAEENSLVFTVDNFFLSKGNIWVYVKPENKQGTYIKLDKELNYVGQFNSITNDIDGFELNKMPWAGSDNSIYYLYKSFELKEQFLKSNDERVNKLSEFVNSNPDLFEDSENVILVKVNLK